MNKEEIQTLVSAAANKKAEKLFQEKKAELESIYKELLYNTKTDMKPMVTELQSVRREMTSKLSDMAKEISSTLLGGIQILQESMKESVIMNEKKTKELGERIEEVAQRKLKMGLGGGGPYQDWNEDSTYNGTLQGTLDGTNVVFTMSARAVNKVVFLYRNGALERLTDYAVQNDQRTIIYSGYPPQSGDVIQSKYPK